MIMRRTAADTLKQKEQSLRKLQKSTNQAEKTGADRWNKIIPLTRKVEPLTRKGKQLTRKVGVKIYGFIFLLKRIFSGNSDPKNVLPTMRKHYCTAALLHDVFRKPHRQSVSLKPKQKTRTSRFLSTLRFLFGTPEGIRTPDLLVRSQTLYPTELLAHTVFRTAKLI